MEAGIALTGTEIKSIRAGRVNLSDAYVRPEGGELWLVNAHIARYEASSYLSHEPTRPRKLLLHRKEINSSGQQGSGKGLDTGAAQVIFKDSLAKVEVALAKGKKLYDKRETITRREAEREMGRAIKRSGKAGRIKISRMGTRGFDRGGELQDCKLRCHSPRKTGGKK